MLRISGGSLRGKRLDTVTVPGFRPTTEMVRQALFNILSRVVVGATFLDLFAGVGTVGIEALSRGAERAFFIEKNRTCIRALLANLRKCDFLDAARVYHGSVKVRLAQIEYRPVDLVFMDPPYGGRIIRETLDLLGKQEVVKPEGLVIAEHSIRDDIPAASGFTLKDKRRYGDTILSFYTFNR